MKNNCKDLFDRWKLLNERVKKWKVSQKNSMSKLEESDLILEEMNIRKEIRDKCSDVIDIIDVSGEDKREINKK